MSCKRKEATCCRKIIGSRVSMLNIQTVQDSQYIWARKTWPVLKGRGHMACLSTWPVSREDGSVLRLPPVGRITSSKDQGSRCLPHWAEALSLWVSITVETLLGNMLGSLLSLYFTLKVDTEATRGVSWAKEMRQFPGGKCGGREIQGPTPRSWEHFWNPRREDVDHLKDVQWDMKV